MKNLNIPVGISDFERIRELNYYYVDKTGLIKTLLQGEMDQVTLITRPRRFGKTMAMNMLNSFLDIRKDSRHLFKGLEISDEVKICEKWMNQYPTLFLSFKDVDGTTFENAFNFLKFIISEACKQHVYLLDSDEIDEGDKLVFQKLKTCSASMMEIQSCILRITNMLKSYYKKPVILLIDEYDVPIAKASSNGYYKEMLEIMKGLLSTALKDNSSLKFAVITGCLKIAKESIFTGTNNFVSDTISSTRYNEYYGFTQQDVDKLLADAEIEEKAEAAAQYAGIAPDAPKIVMEVTLVKVTTKISGDNETTTTAVTPVQPSDIVTVRIPYPEGVRKDQHDIVIIHLRSDGVVDVYSEAKDNLILKEDYMEISVTSFSPFVVSYTDKPDKPEYPDQPDTPDTPDTPTSNASVEGGMAVWTSANALHIRADRPAEAWVVGLSGASRARFAVVPGETRYALPAGVYLVRIADQTYKVRIRN